MAITHHPIKADATFVQGGGPGGGTHAWGQNWQSAWATDMMCDIGTPLVACFGGKIVRAGSLGSGGRFAGLRIGLQGATSAAYYAHMSRLAVGVGDVVTPGQTLGWSGEAVGVAHLHFALTDGSYDRALLAGPHDGLGINPIVALKSLVTLVSGNTFVVNDPHSQNPKERKPLWQVIDETTPLGTKSAKDVVALLNSGTLPRIPDNADEVLAALYDDSPLGTRSVVQVLWAYLYATKR